MSVMLGGQSGGASGAQLAVGFDGSNGHSGDMSTNFSSAGTSYGTIGKGKGGKGKVKAKARAKARAKERVVLVQLPTCSRSFVLHAIYLTTLPPSALAGMAPSLVISMLLLMPRKHSMLPTLMLLRPTLGL
jgi:hypothetical protein